MIVEMGNILVKSAAVDLGIQLTGWAAASLLKTEKFYDLAGYVTISPLGTLTVHRSVSQQK